MAWLTACSDPGLLPGPPAPASPGSSPASAPAPRQDGPAVPSGPELTPRETTILRAVADGRTTKAISQDLWLSEHTVKFHLTNIYRKLGVSNRSAAVRYAFENDLTGPSGALSAVTA